MSYLSLPFVFLKFWFIDAPMEIIGFFGSVNGAFFQLFSLPLFIRTFFQPLKNEYRQGLVGFSRGMGMVLKSVFILFDLLIFSLMLIFEITVFFSFVLFPIITIYLLFL
jgi:hypothetical protein